MWDTQETADRSGAASRCHVGGTEGHQVQKRDRHKSKQRTTRIDIASDEQAGSSRWVISPSNLIKCFGDTFILETIQLNVKIYYLQGYVTDILALTKTLQPVGTLQAQASVILFTELCTILGDIWYNGYHFRQSVELKDTKSKNAIGTKASKGQLELISRRTSQLEAAGEWFFVLKFN